MDTSKDTKSTETQTLFINMVPIRRYVYLLYECLVVHVLVKCFKFNPSTNIFSSMGHKG